MRFSIVTPSYRNGPWLKLCLASVADQDVPVEHIVQDAGSDDGTLDWLLQETRARPFVEKDQGMYDGINRGLRKATGDIVAHLNCDEQYLPGALAAVGDFFTAHPHIDVLFADAVVVDTQGQYLWHRKSLLPQSLHTQLFALSTLTCTTFFRRRVLDEHDLYFDPNWRYCGDSVWIMKLLKLRLPMATLRRFTSVFTLTGDNLSLHPALRTEASVYLGQASPFARWVKPLVLLHHRLRRLCGGVYYQKPFRFALYTQQNPARRVEQFVARPSFRWRG